MKKLIAVMLLLAACFAFSGCKKDGKKYYEPVKSTKEEATTVMTLKCGDETYEVRYELYRALFLTHRSEVDGGDPTVWSGPDKATYIERIQEIILDNVVDIYSSIALAEDLGLEPYSKSVDTEIKEYVLVSVDGGTMDGVTYLGYDSYDDYLDSLRDMYLNYSVQELIFRSTIASGMIDDYYMGVLTEEQIEAGVVGNPAGKLKYTEQDVLAFYESDDCIRVLRTFVSEDMDTDPEARAQRVRAAENGEESVRWEMIAQGSTTSVPELEAGYVMGRYNLSGTYYEKMTDVAFDLEVGEVGEVIRIHDGERMSYYIIYRAEKSGEHYDENYASIAYIYLRDRIGRIYESYADELRDSVSYTDYLKGLDHSTISMK